MTTSLFINPEIVNAEVEARRARLTHDWQQHPRRTAPDAPTALRSASARPDRPPRLTRGTAT